MPNMADTIIVLGLGVVVLLLFRPGRFRMTFKSGNKAGSVDYQPHRND